MPWSSVSDIPENIRNRDDTESFDRSDWEQWLGVVNGMLEYMPEDEAIPAAIEQVQADEPEEIPEEERTEWVQLHSTGPIRQDGEIVQVTQAYLDNVVESFKEHQRDLNEAGLSWKPPINRPLFGPHVDSGRRDGDVLDMKTERGLLLGKVRWTPSAYRDREEDRLRNASVNIVPEHTDSQLNKTYRPFFKEASPTNHNKDKAIDLSAAEVELTASELYDLGLEVEASDEDSAGDDGPRGEAIEAADDASDNQTDPPPEDDSMHTFADFLDSKIQKRIESDDNELVFRRDAYEQLAEGTGMEPAALAQMVEKGEMMLPPDALVENTAEWLGVDVQSLRSGEVAGFGAPKKGGDGSSDDAPSDESSGSDSEGAGMQAGDDEPEGMTASEGGDDVEALRDKIDSLEEKLERTKRVSQMNTSKTSEPGEQPLEAAEGDDGGDEVDLKHLSHEEALETVKDEEGLSGREAVERAKERRGEA